MLKERRSMSKYLEDLIAFHLALKIQELCVTTKSSFFNTEWGDNMMDRLLKLKKIHRPDDKV